jgi:hypothetical protein
MKNLQTFQEFVNENFINEKYDYNTGFPFETNTTLSSQIKMQQETGEVDDDMLAKMKTNFETIAKQLKGNINSVTYAMSEGDDYRFVVALNYGLAHRVEEKDRNIKELKGIGGEAPFGGSDLSGYIYNIKDINVDVAVWEEGDEYSSFQHVACLTKDAKKLEKWVNDNMTEADFENDY